MTDDLGCLKSACDLRERLEVIERFSLEEENLVAGE